jgi:hypothetical protein
MVPLLGLTRYAAPAQHVLVLAEQQALADGDAAISTGDMLLGLLRADGAVAARAWRRWELPPRMCAYIAARLPTGHPESYFRAPQDGQRPPRVPGPDADHWRTSPATGS